MKQLKGAQIYAPDLRAGAALTIAGLAAEGVTQVDGIVFIQRGYEDFEGKLRSLGATIEKIDTDDTQRVDEFLKRNSCTEK